ncbi:MAG: 50S ribosomal protein L11 methyltransferase [Deltaproteobacteria bacterium]|nr:50S ribosomal protein L11 methyltransferase [Deltaproteobacteria bacterium]
MWTEVQIETTEEGADLVAATLAELTGGVEIRDAQTLIAAQQGRSVVVALCVPEAQDEVLAAAEEVLGFAREAGTMVDPVAVRTRLAHEEEWRDVWKQFFRSTRIGQRFVVRPSWDQGSTLVGDHIIDLDPGRAFGTGAHPSTRLVIALCEGLADRGFAPQRVLDLGCGSGILAIAAARLWPTAQILAVDNDPEATACTEENLERNHVNTVVTETAVLSRGMGTFDVILANIQADVLCPLAEDFWAATEPTGHVLLSGILIEQANEVAAAFGAAGFIVEERQDEGEWAGLRCARP